jgi:hypothetical protein
MADDDNLSQSCNFRARSLPVPVRFHTRKRGVSALKHVREAAFCDILSLSPF